MQNGQALLHLNENKNDSENQITDSNAKERQKKRKLRDIFVSENNSPDYIKKYKLGTMAMDPSSSAHSPNNGIIRPMNNQKMPMFSGNNHFRQNSKSTNISGYGSKPPQAKKLVIKNFKGKANLRVARKNGTNIVVAVRHVRLQK